MTEENVPGSKYVNALADNNIIIIIIILILICSCYFESFERAL
jgi:hypothetical protein